jgi:hypothetical protein
MTGVKLPRSTSTTSTSIAVSTEAPDWDAVGSVLKIRMVRTAPTSNIVNDRINVFSDS